MEGGREEEGIGPDGLVQGYPALLVGFGAPGREGGRRFRPSLGLCGRVVQAQAQRGRQFGGIGQQKVELL